ncbi:MAG: PH domain-containing protein [Candidatus Thorarchaeota archaeon]
MEDERVIKPPFESVKSGKIFKPSSKYRNKVWFEAVITAVSIWTITVGVFMGLTYLVNPANFNFWFNTYWMIINLWFWGIALSILIPYVLLIPIYINSYEYSVMAQSGDPMPEITKRSGIINITEKVIPLRSVTNVSSKAGPFDRLMKIGCVEIETAGYSGAYQTGPEIKISGIIFYEELKEWLVMQLRKFKEPYVLGTETPRPHEEPVPRIDDSLDDEILVTLREIRDNVSVMREVRDLLRKLDGKLSEESE